MIYAYIILIGLAFGSFCNVVIFRLPKDEKLGNDRSRCMHCGHQLAWYDLIPVISWVTLLGKCRYCKKSISIQYPLVELYTAGMLLATYIVFAQQGIEQWLFAFIVVMLFTLLGIIDLRHLILPDSLQVSLAVLAVAALLYPLFPIDNAIAVNVFMAIVLAGAFFAIWHFSKGLWLGFGDVKLIGVIGLLFGWPGSVAILYIAVFVGLIIGLVLMALQKAKMKTKLPFGTLLAGASIVYLFYADILNGLVDTLLY